MALLTVLTSLLVAFLSWQLFTLHKHYTIAKTTGLPIIFTPWGVLHPIWPIGGQSFQTFLQKLPFGLGEFAKFSSMTTYLPERYHRHAKLGNAYIVVSPGSRTVVVADAAAAEDVLARRKDFIKHPSMYDPLNIYGPNVDTLNGDEWQRHRRLTAPPFNEKNSSLVWREALNQADAMLKIWLSADKSGVARGDDDIATLALHVLAGAGFGQSFPFDHGLSKPAPGHTFTYRDSLRYILHNIFTSIVFGKLKIPPKFLFGNLLTVKRAMDEFGEYMVEMVENEHQAIARGEKSKDNLMSVLVRSVEAGRVGQGRSTMTNEEILGNLFIYNLAGHDTAAGLLWHAIVLLAAFPKVQDWIHEEIELYTKADDAGEWQYEEVFPRLKRCLAVMYETLRFIGAVPLIPKHTDATPQLLTIDGREVLIPAETFVFLHLPAIHSKPDYWGEDSLEWRPSRWLSSDAEETFLEPPSGNFVAWSNGPRICPGKKFSQVEVVATLATLFRKHQVRPVLQRGETAEGASKRLLRDVQDCTLGVSLRVNDPESMRFRWEART